MACGVLLKYVCARSVHVSAYTHVLWSIFMSFFLSPVSLKVQVYTRTPAEVGQVNLLLCHVSGFHPPQISVDLLKNGLKLSSSLQTDLIFEESWQYQLTKYVSFTPTKGDSYACRVTHMGESRTFPWGMVLSKRRNDQNVHHV